MIRKRLIVVMAAGVLGMAMVGGRGIALAAEGQDTKSQAAPADAGNKTCPVTGEEIGKGSVTYTYKGKVYHFCCASCIADFKKDPEKYIKKMKEEAKKQKAHEHHE